MVITEIQPPPPPVRKFTMYVSELELMHLRAILITDVRVRLNGNSEIMLNSIDAVLNRKA